MKTMTYLLNLTLLVVCTQFVFADNSGDQANKVFISPAEEVQNQADEAFNDKLNLMYPGKEYNPVDPQDTNPNEQNINFTVGGGRSTVEVYFCPDPWWYESSWNVFDSDGNGYYDGNYGVWHDSCESELLDLADGDYTITLYDSYGDGGLWAGVYNPGVGTYAEFTCAGYESSASFTVGTPGPGWEDTPGAYEFTASLTTVVIDNMVTLGDAGDILGAFDADGNVRGIGILQDGIGPSEGTTMHAITVRSNAAGDAISFQYYDASEDEILQSGTSYTFVINDLQGDLFNGVGYDVHPDGQLKFAYSNLNTPDIFIKWDDGTTENHLFYSTLVFLPRLEFSGLLTFAPGSSGNDGSNTYKDLAVFAQYHILKENELVRSY